MKKKIIDIVLLIIPLRFAISCLSFLRHFYDKFVFFDRIFISNKYLSGSGIEIGALHAPLVVPPGLKVRYVDRMSVAALRKQYPELKKYDLVNVDIEDDGEKLSKIQDRSLDFVIANHFLEHTKNPILALINMFRVLKSGGILYLALPDKRYTFDINRQVTEFSHILDDYKCGPNKLQIEHYYDWAKYVSGVDGDLNIQVVATDLMDRDYSIHFHVWTQKEMFEMLREFGEMFNVVFDIEMFLKRGRECIFVLKKA